MKLSELEVGKIYRCNLSGGNVLVVMTTEQKQTNEKGEEIVVAPSVMAGKSVVKTDNGDYKFVYTELHDGQLKTKT